MKQGDADTCLERKTSILFVADQLPFDIGPSTFCLLQPLMTVDGVRFGDLMDQFPNRARVWWMIRMGLGEITPGSLWTGRLQTASIGDLDSPDKDHYQVAKEEIEPSSKDWVSIVEYDQEPPALEMILDGQLDAPPTRPGKELLLRFRGATMGLFKLVDWGSGSKLQVSPLDLGRPQVTRAPSTRLPNEERFDLHLSRHSRNPMEVPTHTTIVLVPRKVALTLKGITLDAMTPAQVIRWGLERAGYSRTQQKSIRDSIEAAGKLQASDGDSERLQRFRELCGRAAKGIDLGVEVAQALGDYSAFKPLLEGHREKLLEIEVRRLVGERKRQIDEQIANQEKELARKKGDVEALQANYDTVKAAQERHLAEEHSSWLNRIQEREDQIARAERELADKQAKFGRAFEGAIAEYRERSQTVLQEVLTLMPLLSGTNPGAPQQTTATTSPSLLPSWLDAPKDRAGSIDKEKDFLGQFAEVARRRGFNYPEDVLVALHASVKSGSWTVLAGPSGLGKSTLPALYAEALGQRQELLQVPVRPDWLDDRQVLGAFNPLVNRFESSATGITEHLIQAAEDWRRQRGGIYLFLLDEMNLARVEHYFARFLSVLERRSDERTIELFSRTQENPADPMARHRVLAVPPNVRFIGTVNLDETVHFFSPKVLDRCSVVGLSAGPLDPALHPQATARDLGVRPVLWSSYESWCRPPAECPPSIVQLLQTIDEALRAAHLGLGYRAFQRARTFAAGARELLPSDVVTDFAVFQFVLPRVRTMQRDAKRVLDHLKRLLPAERYPRSSAAVARMQDGDEFFHVIG